MGNYFSCVSLNDFPVVKIMDLSVGNVLEFGSSRTVAEFMIESPGFMVASADEARRSCRVVPMRADEETKIGSLYVLFPMDRANSRVSDEELALVNATMASRSAGARTGRSKVFPAVGAEKKEHPKKMRIEKLESPADGMTHLRLPNYRRWRPELQSINELKCIR